MRAVAGSLPVVPVSKELERQMKQILALLIVAIGVPVGAASAQTNIAGNWQGTITFGPQTLRVGLVLTPVASGYSASLVIIDQDGAVVPVQQATLTGNALHLDIPNLRAAYDGTLSATGNDITGAMSQQGMPNPLNFTRVARLDSPPVFGDQEKADVAAVVNNYFAAFSRKDYAALGNTETVPFLRWFVGGTPNVATSIEDVVTVSRTTRDGLDNSDYALSRAAEMIITPLSATSAMVDVHWRRDKKDGSLLQEGAEILTLLKTPAGWRINSVIGRALSHYGKRF
jgi:hypothetical protein